MNKNQKGFAVFELLFFVLLVIVLIGGAYYVGTKQHSNKSPANTAQTKLTKKSTTVSAPASKSDIYKFTNLGVQFTLPSSISDLQSTPQTFSDGSFADVITTSSIENDIKQCSQGQATDPESLSFASISKISGQYDPNQIYGEIQFLKQFSSFFIAIGYPNGNSPCGTNQSAASQLATQEHSASDAFVKAFQSTATEIK